MQNHGHCVDGKSCKFSHDIELILDLEENRKSRKKRKRKKTVDNGTEESKQIKMRKIEGEEEGEEGQDKDKDTGEDKEKEKIDIDTDNDKDKDKGKEKIDTLPLPSTHKKRKRKRRKGVAKGEQKQQDITTPITPTPITSTPTLLDAPPRHELLPKDVHIGRMHSAGFDAFATGFIYCHLFLRFGGSKMHALGNNIYLIGKDFPLKLQQSQYSTST